APDRTRRPAGQPMAASPWGGGLGDLRACDAFDVMTRIDTIRAPTLAICGEEDRRTPPKYSRFFGERIAGSRVVVVPGSGHYVQVEQSEPTTAALREFVRSCCRRSGIPLP